MGFLHPVSVTPPFTSKQLCGLHDYQKSGLIAAPSPSNTAILDSKPPFPNPYSFAERIKRGEKNSYNKKEINHFVKKSVVKTDKSEALMQ